MPTYKPTLLQQLDALPPFTCYALARNSSKRRDRMRLDELAKTAGMSERTFIRIARKFSWAGVKVGDADAFARACGVDLLRQMKTRNYLRHSLGYKRPLAHLSSVQLATFLKQCKEWTAMVNKVKPSAEPAHQTTTS